VSDSEAAPSGSIVADLDGLAAWYTLELYQS